MRACAPQAARLSDWALTIGTRSREYNGERRLNHNVVAISPLNFAKEAQRMLDVVQRYA